MKLFLLAVFATAALAAPEAIWSEDGQYKLIDKEPLTVEVVPEEGLTWSEDGQYKLVPKEPLAVEVKDGEIVKDETPIVKYLEPEVQVIEKEPLTIEMVAPELTWSEDGQYKLVAKEPLAVRLVSKDGQMIMDETPIVRYVEPEELKRIQKEPLRVVQDRMGLGYIPISYGNPMAYRRLVYRDFAPFTYRYQQISH